YIYSLSSLVTVLSSHLCYTLVVTAVLLFCVYFFFQAEDGIRDRNVTGVQTCALPICRFIEAEYRPTRSGFTTTGLTDDRNRFTFFNLKADIINRFNVIYGASEETAFYREILLKYLNLMKSVLCNILLPPLRTINLCISII